MTTHKMFFHEHLFFRDINGYTHYDCTLFFLFFFQIKYKRNAIKCITHYMKNNITNIKYRKGKII